MGWHRTTRCSLGSAYCPIACTVHRREVRALCCPASACVLSPSSHPAHLGPHVLVGSGVLCVERLSVIAVVVCRRGVHPRASSIVPLKGGVKPLSASTALKDGRCVACRDPDDSKFSKRTKVAAFPHPELAREFRPCGRGRPWRTRPCSGGAQRHHSGSPQQRGA